MAFRWSFGIPAKVWKRGRSVKTGLSIACSHQRRAPSGINMDPIQPAVFAPSIAEKLMIEMPMVESGTYATGTISQSVTGDAVAKSADVPQTAGTVTVGTTGPHRVGANLALAVEDIAQIGTANFESMFRSNVSMALSAELR